MSDFIGHKVVKVRPLTEEEAEEEGWDHRGDCAVLVFDDGSLIYASRDPEGNGPGALFGKTADGTAVMIQ